MDTDLLNSKFARIGARLMLADRPARRSRIAGATLLVVRADRKGGFFEIARRLDADADAAIFEVQPADPHLPDFRRRRLARTTFHPSPAWLVL